MNKRSFYTLITISFIISIFSDCEKDDKVISNIDLLTNNSSKIWYKKQVVTNDLITIEEPSCISDDERKFMIDGKCLIDNMGTFLKVDSQFPGAFPPHCKDTINIVDTVYWNFNSEMDTLTIFYSNFVKVSKILKLTNDSLIMRYAVNPSWFQTDIYVSMKTK